MCKGIKNFFRNFQICAKVLSLFVENLRILTYINAKNRRSGTLINIHDWCDPSHPTYFFVENCCYFACFLQKQSTFDGSESPLK
jgi:hypothetical protein